MQKRVLTLALATAFMSTSALANQAEGTYAEANYANVMVDPGTSSDDLNFGVLTGTFGYNIINNFAVEGFVGYGVVDDDLNNVAYDVNQVYGVNFKSMLDFSQNLSGVLKVGYLAGEVEASVSNISATDDLDDVTFAAGLEYTLAPELYLTTTYTHIDSDTDAIIFGLGKTF